MEQLQAVALWIGVIVGVAGVVLSGVAIWFAFAVDKRSTQVSTTMAQSLLKLEAHVERSSETTQTLIKAAWDKLLGVVPVGPGVLGDEAGIKDLVKGIAKELKLEVAGEAQVSEEGQDVVEGIGETGEGPRADRIDELAKLLESAAERLGPTSSLGEMVQRLSRLSPMAVALVRALLRSPHLSRTEYRRVQANGLLGPAVRELREEGLLVPLEGAEGDLVYWLPPDSIDTLASATSIVGHRGGRDSVVVRRELQRVRRPRGGEGEGYREISS